MSRTRRRLFWVVVAAQAVVPLAMIGWSEVALATGERVRLATAPVDPVDLFRGRYVTLRYEISSLPVDREATPGETVYVPLRQSGDIWVGTRATTARPESGTFIRGHVRDGGAGRARIEYGIETYYADEDEAPELERSTGRLLVDVVLDDDGGARIDGIEARD